MKKILLLILILSLAFGTDSKGASSSDDEIAVQDVPEVVISYAVFCSRYAEFKTLESNPANVLIRLSKMFDGMEKSLASLKLNFCTRLGFDHRSFIVQTNISGHLSGLIRENDKIPSYGMFFVTTPIETFGNRSLLFLSSPSPERTTIVSVDKMLKVEFLYDSSQEKKEIVPGLGRIDSIRVKASPGLLLLEERTARNAPIQGPPRTGRTFIVDVTKGTFELSRTDKTK